MNTIYDYIPYPEIYYMIYPKITQSIQEYFGGYEIAHDMSQSEIDNMIENVYEKIVSECPEIQEDQAEIESNDVDSLRRPYFGRRRLLRDMVGIIFLGELFRRMGGNNRYGQYPNYGYQPYGYDSYGYDSFDGYGYRY